MHKVTCAHNKMSSQSHVQDGLNKGRKTGVCGLLLDLYGQGVESMLLGMCPFGQR